MIKYIFVLIVGSLPGILYGQPGSAFSNPYAPVGDVQYTVPKSAVPILDEWMRDTYIMLGPDSMYYLTGTTAAKNRHFTGGVPHPWDYNDGIYLWRSPDLKHWDSLGLIWSFDKDATWQKKGVPLPPDARGVNKEPLDSFYRAVWAPELHYIKARKQWLLVACLSGRVGSFVLKSTSGKPAGPYVNIEGNKEGPIFSKRNVLAIAGNKEPANYSGIDLSLFEDEDGIVYLIGKDHYIAKMKDDLSDIAAPFRRFIETPYNPDPYIEGVFMLKHQGRYLLMQTVWSYRKNDGTFSYLENSPKNKGVYSYDVVVAESDNIYGPYGPRYPAILQGGHNNVFKDKSGKYWSTIFFNPRGEAGLQFPVTCRPSMVAVKWKKGKMMPDIKRTDLFFKSFSKNGYGSQGK